VSTNRIAPLPVEHWDDNVRDALGVLVAPERLNPTDAGNLLGTLVRNPALTKAYLHFNKYILVDNTLSARIREIAILRAAHLRESPYLWSHHIPLAQRAGLTLDEIAAIERGEAASDFDRAVIRAVDELAERARISDDTWAALGEYLDDQERTDLIFTVGCYSLLATVVNTLGIQEENPDDHIAKAVREDA
jgi:4-carboxymuconolactone decarboxylase